MKYKAILNLLLSLFAKKAIRTLKEGDSTPTMDVASDETLSEGTFRGPSLDQSKRLLFSYFLGT